MIPVCPAAADSSGSDRGRRCRKQDGICLAFLEFSPVLKELLNGVPSLRPELSQPGLGGVSHIARRRVSHIITISSQFVYVLLCNLKCVFSGLGLP